MNNPFDFSGRTVLVVGGSSGIGNGIAQGFRARNADVHVVGTRDKASDYEAAQGSDLEGLHYSKLDVSDPDAIDAYEPRFDKLDVLVLSQGHVVYKRGEFDRPGWDQVMAINLDGLMHCARRLRSKLEAARGALIIISSTSAYTSNKGNPAYAASKAGAVSLTKTLGEAWIGEGIRVNGIAPGFVDTKLTAVTTSNPKRMAAAIAAIPVGRLGTPADMANVALFLASPLADYIVGQTIVVDGGLTLS